MPRTVAIGVQDFEKLVLNNNFYIDKTAFIKEWWESNDEVTLITRPRRFGKTLNMSMLERFFSIKYQKQGEVFEKLDIWKEKEYRELQGTYPVLFLSFAGIKETEGDTAIYRICGILKRLYITFYELLDSNVLTEGEKAAYKKMADEMPAKDAPMALSQLSDYLYRYYGKKVIILLDEYDTPLQEAYVNGFWQELVAFTRNLFNNTFKTNPYMERAVLTGITRISKESMFSDLNNLNVASVTSSEYASCFGFMEAEVFCAMDEFGLTNKEEVKRWYDGFNIGDLRDIYNPWSVINYLDKRKLKPYWVNTSSNGLAGRLIRQGSKKLKIQFKELLQHHSIKCELDEEIVFNQLDNNAGNVWSLFLASGYLTPANVEDEQYELVLTNYEVERMFRKMVRMWFAQEEDNYSDFIKALLLGDLKEMNSYMNRVSLSMFSSFDGGNRPSETTNPERFYHGFVLGLLVDLAGRYEVSSNRESGFGRYDVILKPIDKKDDGITNNGIKNDAIIMEFKVHDPEDEHSLEETVQAALKQIEEKRYEQELLDSGIDKERIRKYGFAFEGKKVLIG